MIITLSGKPGSGKTTIGRLLAQKLGYKHYSMGDLMGKFATEQRITLEELQEKRKTDSKWDKEVDNYQRQLGMEEDNFVVDGHLSWHFIPHAFKVMLDVDPRTGAERVFKNQRPDEKKYSTIEKLQKAQQKRIEKDVEKWKKIYKINPYERKHYQIIINTTNLTPEEVVEQILDAL